MAFVGGELAEVLGECFVFAVEEEGQGGAEVGALHPFAHVVFPRLPHALCLLVHALFVYEQISAFEERDEDAEDRETALFLFVGEIVARGLAAQQLQIGVVEHELEELAVFVGETLENFLLVVHAFFALFQKENDDRERQADDGDDVAEKFEKFEKRHTALMDRAALLGKPCEARTRIQKSMTANRLALSGMSRRRESVPVLARHRRVLTTNRMKRRQLRGYDLKQIEGFSGLIGVDEAGRGALAGPVVAGAVLVTKEFLESRWAVTRANRVNDSKQLTPAERDELWFELETLMAQRQIHATYGVATVEEIEQWNILGATKLAMRRALEGIYPPTAFQQKVEPDLFASPEEIASFQPQVSARILIDGLPLKSFPYPHTGVVKGDARSLCIAMASIVAKVTRDRLMKELETVCPGYGFDRHKGYGTEEHREALLRIGRCAHHREVFLRKLLARRVDPAQVDFLSDDWVSAR